MSMRRTASRRLRVAPNKRRVGAVGHGARHKRLARALQMHTREPGTQRARQRGGSAHRRSVEQHALGRVDAELDKALGVQQRQLDHLAQLFELLLLAADVGVRAVGLLFDLHHGDRRVDLGRQRNLDLVLLPLDADAHALLDVGRRHLVANVDHVLAVLLERDHVLGVLGVGVDNRGAARHLQRLLAQRLLVGHQVPHCCARTERERHRCRVAPPRVAVGSHRAPPGLSRSP